MLIKDIEEKEYRAIPVDSSSSLKDFSVDRKKYRKRYMLKEHVAEKDNLAVLMGQLVETLLMEPERFDELFYMSACASPPSGLMEGLVLALVKHTIANTEDGVLKLPFLDLFELAYKDSEFKITSEAVLKKFVGTDNEIFYEELVKVRVNNLLVVTPDDVNNAERIVDNLKGNAFTATLVNLKTGGSFEVINQMKISGFKIDELPMKAMLDKVIINHTDKSLFFIDLKCTWGVETFYKEYYLFRRAYIQAYVYQKALQALTKDPKSSVYGYKVDLPKFLVCDSINYLDPLMFEVAEQDIKEAYFGFERRGYKYPGVKQIIEDLKFAKEKDVWSISKTNYENFGKVKLDY